MSSTPRSGGTLAAQLSQISYNKMLNTNNTKPTSSQLNQLMAENATLKHRLNSTIEDLREAREIYERQHTKWRNQYEKMKEALAKRAASAAQFENMQRIQQQQLAGGSPERINTPRARLALSNLYQLDKERHEDPLSWNIDLPPWQMAFGQQKDHATAADTLPADESSFFADVSPAKRKLADANVQTDTQRSLSQSAVHPAEESTSDHFIQLRLLNAELLKIQAENVTLRGSVEMLKRDVATDATGQIVQRYEEIATQQIRTLSKALEAANAALSDKERQMGSSFKDFGAAHSVTRSRRSPSNYSATNSIRPNTAGAMQQQLLSKAREKAKRSGGILGSFGIGVDDSMGSKTPQSAFKGNLFRNRALVPTSSIAVGTDQPWVEAPPAGSYYAHDEGGSRQVLLSDAAQPQAIALLQHSLEVTKVQLRQALEELSLAKVASPLGVVSTIHKRSIDVGTQVSEQGEIERLFTLFHEDYNAPNVERILANHQNKVAGVLLALTDAASYTPNEVTKSTLQATRSELITAHEHIEELEFALELERREKERALEYATHHNTKGNRNEGITPGEAARQASHEIAFLCDTLAATKIENEMLHEKLLASERERQIAIHSLSILKKRSTDMVKGCQEITETSKMETEAAMISLLGQVHQKASEASQIRGLLAHSKRSNEDLQLKLDEADKELNQTKAKLFMLRDSTAKLREDFNLATVQLRQYKQRERGTGRQSPPQPFRQLTINSSNIGGNSTKGDDTTINSGNRSGSYALDSPRDSNGPLTRSPNTRKLTTSDSHEISALELLASEGHDQSSPTNRRQNSPNNSSFGAASAGSGGGTRRRAYSEHNATNRKAINVTETISENDCRALLENLIPFAPGALTPNQIVDGVLTSVDLLNDRIGELESELKLKAGHLLTAKKDVALLQQRVRKMETDKEASGAKQQKPSTKDRKELFAAHYNEQVLKESLKAVEAELVATKAKLFESEKELDEGRALMLRLIKE